MSRNLFVQFLSLIPTPSLEVGTAISVGGGEVIVELPGGARIVARGTATPSATVFVRDGVIEGTAPAMTTHIIGV